MGTRTRKSVLLLGKGNLAIRIADWFRTSPDYNLQCAVPVVPEPNWTDSLIGWCQAHDVPHVESGHYQDVPCVQADNWSVDLAFCVFYGKIFPPWFIDKAKCFLNLHNGPLPRYRGVSPINWALKNGEDTHGVTIHKITPEIDAGPIVGQVRYSIYTDFDEVVDVYERSLEYGYVLFEQTMRLLDRITPKPQNEAEAIYYSKRDGDRLGERRGFTRLLSE